VVWEKAGSDWKIGTDIWDDACCAQFDSSPAFRFRAFPTKSGRSRNGLNKTIAAFFGDGHSMMSESRPNIVRPPSSARHPAGLGSFDPALRPVFPNQPRLSATGLFHPGELGRHSSDSLPRSGDIALQ
jgi:hypothetical protein